MSKSLGSLIDSLFRARAKRLELSKKVDELKEKETQLATTIGLTLSDEKLNSAQGKLATFTHTTTDVPVIDDWDVFFKYAKRKDNDDLVMRRVNTTAWRERRGSGVLVPGTKVFTRHGYNLTKRGSA